MGCIPDAQLPCACRRSLRRWSKETIAAAYVGRQRVRRLDQSLVARIAHSVARFGSTAHRGEGRHDGAKRASTMSGGMPVKRTWSESQRFVHRTEGAATQRVSTEAPAVSCSPPHWQRSCGQLDVVAEILDSANPLRIELAS